MYKHSNYYIGQFEVIKIGREGGSGFEVIPAQGGLINQVSLGEPAIPLLDHLLDSEDVAENNRFKQAILFPFPNRLKDGRYNHENTSYSFPINEPERGNALHGLVYDKEFSITELELTDDFGQLELSYIYHGQDDAYPFPFTLRVIYSISDTVFAIKFKVENTGSGILPYGIGWHPYFKTDQTAKIKAPVAQRQLVNKRMLPTGEEQAYDFGEDIRELSEELDTAFRLPDSKTINLVLGDFNSKMLNLRADESFKFIQLYNPQKDIVAAEPVSCNINALNTGDGLIKLSSGEVNEHSLEIALSSET